MNDFNKSKPPFWGPRDRKVRIMVFNATSNNISVI